MLNYNFVSSIPYPGYLFSVTCATFSLGGRGMDFSTEDRAWHSPHETWTMDMAARRCSLILLLLLLCLIPDALAQEAKKEDDKNGT